MPIFHYHADLSCGHKTGFDVPTDLIAAAASQGADAAVEIPCRDCGGTVRESTSLSSGGVDVTICITCGKGMP